MHTIRLDKTVKAGIIANKRWCNLSCIWCHDDYFTHTGFVAISNSDFIYAVNRLIQVLNTDVHIRIAGGGEPTLVGLDELTDLIASLRKIPQVLSIKLTTNGILLGQYARALKDSGLDSVTVSLNSLTPVGYKRYSGQDNLSIVLESLEQAYVAGLRLKINAIYWVGNANELSLYENISRKYNGTPIKFFDLIPSNDMMTPLYLPLSELERRIQHKTNNFKDVFSPYYQRVYTFPSGAIFIVKKSSDVNTCPNRLCKYREVCVEGCRHSIRIGLDGVLKPCGVRDDNTANILHDDVENSDIWQALHNGGKVGY